ncbi:MAG: type I methionyl aminopeptidase [Verrucomicrobiota bacterium]
MIPIKTQDEISIMREVCAMAATVLARMEKDVAVGMTTYDLDQAGRKYMKELGCKSACFNYKVGNSIYPAHTCLSVNEEIVHGIGSIKRCLQEGDVITLDVCAEYKGYVGDNAKTVIIGNARDEQDAYLVKHTQAALQEGIQAARPNGRVGDISHTIQRYLDRHQLGIIRDFVGHGVGASMHEPPQIPNFGRRKTGAKLRAGMTLAIEPMVSLGSPQTKMLDDGWTAVTRDGSTAAHFEHTVLITEDGPEIITVPNL